MGRADLPKVSPGADSFQTAGPEQLVGGVDPAAGLTHEEGREAGRLAAVARVAQAGSPSG